MDEMQKKDHFEWRLNSFHEKIDRVLLMVENQKSLSVESLITLFHTQSKTLHRILALVEITTRLEIKEINSGVLDMSMNQNDFMNALTAKLTNMEDQNKAVITLVSDMKAQLQANIGDPVKMQAILDRFDADAKNLADAILTTPPNNNPNPPANNPPVNDPNPPVETEATETTETSFR